MRRSLESTRPILSSQQQQQQQQQRASTRFSTYSYAPTMSSYNSAAVAAPASTAATEAAATSAAVDPTADMKGYATTLERMESKRLQEQRYVVSPKKQEDMHTLALGAKVQRALDRRLSSQDAVMRPRRLDEKASYKATS